MGNWGNLRQRSGEMSGMSYHIKVHAGKRPWCEMSVPSARRTLGQFLYSHAILLELGLNV